MKGFTLIELLVVVGIMGLLGTASVGGYRQMQRGMEERGVMQNVNQFIRSAYQRAQIDRQPTAVYFWNETLRSATMDANEIVVGKAVAVRRHGRITKVQSGILIDEFGDLDLTYPTDAAEDDEGDAKNTGKFSRMKLYQLDTASAGLRYSIVRDRVGVYRQTEIYLDHDPVQDAQDRVGKGRLDLHGFVVEEPGSATWKVGSAYGLEFATIELPHGYIFGSSYSQSVDNPVREIDTLVFKPGAAGSSQGGTSGGATIQVSSLRPNASGNLSAQRVGTSDAPTSRMNQN